ncbi:hypothetical protein F4819DRAFT_265822 [Hypoxylon fuscum]|nr:hypothetical protein F4819DRAFT_265822 [Hypoxylon fuscum]
MDCPSWRQHTLCPPFLCLLILSSLKLNLSNGSILESIIILTSVPNLTGWQFMDILLLCFAEFGWFHSITRDLLNLTYHFAGLVSLGPCPDHWVRTLESSLSIISKVFCCRKESWNVLKMHVHAMHSKYTGVSNSLSNRLTTSLLGSKSGHRMPCHSPNHTGETGNGLG